MTNLTPTTSPNMTRRSVRPAPPPRNNFERIMWVFMRYSGLVLVFLALSHWGLQHIINSVHNLQLEDTISRWGITGQSVSIDIWFWRAYYAVFLGLAFLHGLNGLRQVAYDYMHIKPLYIGFMTISTLIVVFVMLAGIAALFLGVNVAMASASAAP